MPKNIELTEIDEYYCDLSAEELTEIFKNAKGKTNKKIFKIVKKIIFNASEYLDEILEGDKTRPLCHYLIFIDRLKYYEHYSKGYKYLDHFDKFDKKTVEFIISDPEVTDVVTKAELKGLLEIFDYGKPEDSFLEIIIKAIKEESLNRNKTNTIK